MRKKGSDNLIWRIVARKLNFANQVGFPVRCVDCDDVLSELENLIPPVLSMLSRQMSDSEEAATRLLLLRMNAKLQSESCLSPFPIKSVQLLSEEPHAKIWRESSITPMLTILFALACLCPTIR